MATLPAERKPLAELTLRAGSARSAIEPFMVMDVMVAAAAREAAGHRVIHMEVGQPATPAPRAAREAVKRLIDSDNLGYTLALGTDPLRARIARLYRDWYGLEVAPNRIVVTAGSSGAFILAFLALFDTGARVALPAPGYPCYRHILSALGQVPVALETGPATRWMPTAAQIAAAAAGGGLDGVLIASPANPTGTMLEPARLAEIARGCRERGLWLVSDEIYHGLAYGMEQASALQFNDDAIVINSFSKYFSMTGWRVGWMVVPERIVRVIERLAQNLFICAPAISQAAALAAFDGLDELEANKRVYRANRELLMTEMPRAGFDNLVPADGAFYLYADVSAQTDDAGQFARRMLDETGVAATPGLDFDPARGRHFMRFSYARSTADMTEAVRRLQAWRR